jgi:hypothetical protein
MQNWKKAAIAGSIGAGAVLFFTGRKTAGMGCATAGLVLLASEYPDRFEELWEHAPEYVTRGMQIWNTLSQVAERFAEQAAERAEGTWREISAERGFAR